MTALYRLFCCLLMATAIAQTSSAQTLHALVAGCTNDPSIGKGAKQNVADVSNLLQSAAAAMDCEFDFEVFEDPQCTKANVINWINNLDIEKDDVVVFFYSGHGGRALNDSDPFPQMCMNNPRRQDLFMPVAQVDKLIAAKSPRLRIIITECCNSESAGIKSKPLFAMAEGNQTSLSTYNVKALRDLFFNTEGKVMITSSKAKEYSWMLPDGGIFMHNFIDAFNEAAIHGSLTADWSAIFNRVHDNTFGLQIPHNGQIYRQEPYASISKSKDADKPIIKRRDYQPGSLFESLQYLLNPIIPVENRLAKIPEILSRHFATGAKVMTIAANGRTVVDYEDADKFLKRIAISPYIKQINVLSGSNDEKNSLIKVHELRQ